MFVSVKKSLGLLDKSYSLALQIVLKLLRDTRWLYVTYPVLKISVKNARPYPKYSLPWKWGQISSKWHLKSIFIAHRINCIPNEF